jgi:hypothetical protein
MEIAFLQAQAQAQADGRLRDRGNRGRRKNNRGSDIMDDMDDIFRRTLDEK